MYNYTDILLAAFDSQPVLSFIYSLPFLIVSVFWIIIGGVVLLFVFGYQPPSKRQHNIADGFSIIIFIFLSGLLWAVCPDFGYVKFESKYVTALKTSLNADNYSRSISMTGRLRSSVLDSKKDIVQSTFLNCVRTNTDLFLSDLNPISKHDYQEVLQKTTSYCYQQAKSI